MAATIRAFMFHDIRNLNETKYPSRYELKSFINKKQFEFQIDYICANYTIIRGDEVNYKNTL